MVKTKALISCAITTQLIGGFVFAYAKIRFSHDGAHFKISIIPSSKKFMLNFGYPYKNEKVASRLQFGCCYYAAIKCVCNNWWRQSSHLERLVACLQQPCSFYQLLQFHRATTSSQLQLAAVTSKKTARTHSF